METVKYTTHNMYYAAYLVYMGFECIEVMPSTYKEGFYDFAFAWIGDVKSYETNFFSQQGIVEPRAYTKIVATLRDMLNARKNADLAKNPPVYK